MEKQSSRNILLWILAISYTAVTLIFPFLPVSELVFAGLVVGIGTFFAIFHGILRYGSRGMLVFIGLCLIISNILENLSIQTGFPFGSYHYTDLLGPKLFTVPLLIGPAYFATGYLSWTIANVLLDKADKKLNRFNVIILPVIASFIMVMWDVVMDPTSSTIRHLWIWHDGGGFFGVPLSNYLGWFLTVYLFYQAFAIYLFKKHQFHEIPLPQGYWYQSIWLYLVIGLSFFINYLTDTAGSVSDAAGFNWSKNAIHESAIITSLYTMVFVSILALVRLISSESKSKL